MSVLRCRPLSLVQCILFLRLDSSPFLVPTLPRAFRLRNQIVEARFTSFSLRLLAIFFVESRVGSSTRMSCRLLECAALVDEVVPIVRHGVRTQGTHKRNYKTPLQHSWGTNVGSLARRVRSTFKVRNVQPLFINQDAHYSSQ